eukprot:68049_1
MATDSKEMDAPKDEQKSSTRMILSKSVRTLRLFVPGRICLFGEHSDWAGSYRKMDKSIKKGRCIVCGTNQGIYANVQSHPSKLIVYSHNERGGTLDDNSHHHHFECKMELNALLTVAQSGSTYSYVAGVAYQMLLKHRIGGLQIDNYLTTLPLKKGLSSSAAVCVLTARAFNKIYDLKLTIEGEMDYGYLGERTTPSQCGRMDQCCAYGARPVSMEFDEDDVKSRELQFGSHSHSLYLVIVDLNKSKDTQKILSDLNKCYNEARDSEISANVRTLLGDINLDITERAMLAIKKGEIHMVGQLMNEAQALFLKYAQPACPQELTSQWLYKVLQCDKIQPHIYGGKGVGSQGDGSAQLLCKSQTDQDAVCSIIEEEFKSEGMQCIKLVIGGFQKIRKCVIPTANYGSSLFPSSKCISTALFPIIDGNDGLLKPAILILVEQVIQCGIDEIYLIVSPHDLKSFESLFYTKLPLEQTEKLSPELQRYSEKILSYGTKVKLIIQTEQLGLGHAVYQAKEYVCDEKFLLLLGDHLYKTTNADSSKGCIQQLMDYYLQNGCNCYGLQVTPKADLKNFGAVCGKWINGHKAQKTLYIEDIVEKPNIEYAEKHLRVDGLSEDEFLTIFGLYILDGTRLVELLANNINNKPPIRHNGTFQLTPCLQLLGNEQETHGLIIDGVRYDIGTNPQKYVDTVHNFHHKRDKITKNKEQQQPYATKDVLSKIDALIQMI